MNTMMQCTPCLDVGPVAAANQAAFARALAAAQGVIQGGGSLSPAAARRDSIRGCKGVGIR